jgi:hypothetical protein
LVVRFHGGVVHQRQCAAGGGTDVHLDEVRPNSDRFLEGGQGVFGVVEMFAAMRDCCHGSRLGWRRGGKQNRSKTGEELHVSYLPGGIRARTYLAAAQAKGRAESPPQAEGLPQCAQHGQNLVG